MGFFSKYDFSISLTLEPEKSLKSTFEKTPSLKNETKSSNKAKNTKFIPNQAILSFKIRICQATLI